MVEACVVDPSPDLTTQRHGSDLGSVNMESPPQLQTSALANAKLLPNQPSRTRHNSLLVDVAHDPMTTLNTRGSEQPLFLAVIWRSEGCSANSTRADAKEASLWGLKSTGAPCDARSQPFHEPCVPLGLFRWVCWTWLRNLLHSCTQWL